MNDVQYLSLLAKMENEDISEDDIRCIEQEAEVRLRAVGLPDWLPLAPKLTIYFPRAWIDFSYFQDVKKRSHEAAKQLEDAATNLEKILFSALPSAPEDIAYPELNDENVALHDFLRSAAQWVREAPKDIGFHQIENPTGRKLKFKSFWVRHINQIVSEFHMIEIKERRFHPLASREERSNLYALHSPNIRIIASGEWGTSGSEIYGHNAIVAKICSVLLAQEITPNDVAQQKQ